MHNSPERSDQSRLLLREALRLALRPLLRLLLADAFLCTGLVERPRDDLLSERERDRENERRPRERLRERRRSRDDLQGEMFVKKLKDENILTVMSHVKTNF